MSKHSRVEALSGAATLASLFLAGVLGAHAGPLGTAAAIVVDSDHDGIPDARDTCSQHQNLEQFDSDQD